MLSNLQKTIEWERKAVCFCVRVIRQWGLSADSFFLLLAKINQCGLSAMWVNGWKLR